MGAVKSPRIRQTRKKRKAVPTHKILEGGRTVRLCEHCVPPKTINYKNFSKHMQDVHSGKPPKVRVVRSGARAAAAQLRKRGAAAAAAPVAAASLR